MSIDYTTVGLVIGAFFILSYLRFSFCVEGDFYLEISTSSFHPTRLMTPSGVWSVFTGNFLTVLST